MPYQAEYIWIDGTEPSPLLRSKTKVIPDGEEPGIWGFDGSSTNQALGHPKTLRWCGGDPATEGFLGSLWLGVAAHVPPAPPRAPLSACTRWI